MSSRMFVAAGFVLAAVWTTAATAQNEVGSGPIRFRLPVEFEYDFETDIDGGGDYAVQRYGFGVIGDTDLTEDVSLSFGTTYALDRYNFNGVTRFGGVDPWDDIHTFDVRARVNWKLANDWGLFAGPVLRWAREDGGDWDDSFTGGAVVGGTYRASSDLSVGLGVGIITQIEDDARFFPIFMVNWRINDQWRLRSATDEAAGGAFGGGLELIYDLGDKWEAGVGFRYEFHRFKLAKSGVVPGGVGEETRIPLYGRLSYAMSDNIDLNLYLGVSAQSELRLEDSSGAKIGDEDADPVGLIGLSLRIKF